MVARGRIRGPNKRPAYDTSAPHNILAIRHTKPSPTGRLSRQDGRLRATNVCDAGYDEDEIYAAIRVGLEDVEFRQRARTCENPYGTGNVGRKIADVLASVELGQKLIRKRMTIGGI